MVVDRDEPARVAVVGARVEGDRLPDREDRRQARARLPPRRDPERHHARSRRRRFEPTIDYVVVKIPRWNFEKFPQADRTLTTQMKSVGEAMAIGRTFKEAFMKGVRSLELGRERPAVRAGDSDRTEGMPARRRATSRCGSGWRCRTIAGCGTCSARSIAAGRVEQVHEPTKIDPWFLQPVRRNRRDCAAAGGARARRAVAGRDAAAEARRLRRRRSSRWRSARPRPPSASGA